jgi:hypothetical protein
MAQPDTTRCSRSGGRPPCNLRNSETLRGPQEVPPRQGTFDASTSNPVATFGKTKHRTR